ncbi:tRNA (adenosine(37)-N6)-threonylcarbamoyltransferase complex ATPase subunit type 1 TsaE [Azoarcus indigens]|uniref:tRNA threonylcarbamoyladenosine biosynthesis protein TsaE n=1 Tax=Azoarcus indigens TaxID=29545 RepID=A0A4R6DXR4_9RHOO|nr:tRNA (adenosine(37)-N6)-threonylcarbamoyltransferase complex ATPase subunit type 1 TsaE [Azoarcus indigens]NMG65652.1 tRNA (adenosine(37)-N6)-threonylcarbamoyltransferase complex ATPase subunit type 1 TsaE [Azoarcus indigens]TDN50081.1 tRNA threonylcarbamoyladenosine biosynthesis protein TsaE [Azoarcus indigens]
MLSTIHPSDDSGGASVTLTLQDEPDTLALGEIIGRSLEPGLQLWLQGNLGAGKTTLTRGMLRGLGHTQKVKSPTYTLIEPYLVSRLDFYHFDFYRFDSPDEYLDAGLDEYFTGQGVCVVEWPDKASPHLPQPDVEIHLSLVGEGRQATVTAKTATGQACLNRLVEQLNTRGSATRPA